tara:strand:- start:12970 stop:14226 length:1257 start_codon:yes stop_codon:yes gene_type:complete
MPFYQEARTMKGAVIGTIMPWTGALSEIPKGWIICDGTSPDAKDYPLLVQVIGDTYNSGSSNLGGAFPGYTGQFVLPNLLDGKCLMDIEGSYFDASTGTGDAIDIDPDARNLIEPFIGENTDNGVPVVFNDVRTDVEFTLNDRNGYSGQITGNTIIDGTGEKSVFIGGRKLGHQHIRNHTHPGVYETILEADRTRPGLGVIPYDNITASFNYASIDVRTVVLGISGGDGKIDKVRLGLKWFKENVQLVDSGSWGSFGSFNGTGGGSPGRTVMGARGENPPVNLSPQVVRQTSIANQGEYSYEQLTSGDVIPYGLFGVNITIDEGLRNYYPDALSSGNFGTFVSNVGADWLDDSIQAHAHDPFTVKYDQNSLKPQPRLTADVNIPINTVLDNNSNTGALEISMNTSQPSLTIVYIIRAY